MKIVGKIFSYIGIFIVSILSIVFAFIEIRPLFYNDYSLMNNPALGFIKFLFRGLFYLLILSLAIYLLITLIRKKKMDLPVIIFSGALFISSLFTINFYVFYVYMVSIICSLILLIIALIPYLINLKNKEA